MEPMHVLHQRPDHLRDVAEARRLARSASRRVAGSTRRRRGGPSDDARPSR